MIKKGYLFFSENLEVIISLGVLIGTILLFIFVMNRKKSHEIEKQEKETSKIEQERYLSRLHEVLISDKRQDYIIEKSDYKRGNKSENEYRKKYVLQLLSLYENKCAKCEHSGNGFDLDHFILSKNEGGNFALRHKDGYWINNAIPLCQTCNRSKGDRPYKDFFTQDEILYLFIKNKQMTLILNS